MSAPFDGRTRGCNRAGEALFPEYDWMKPVKKNIKKGVIKIDPIDVILSKSRDSSIPVEAMQIANRTGFPLDLLQSFSEKELINFIKIDVESQLFNARKEWETERNRIDRYRLFGTPEQYEEIKNKLFRDLIGILAKNVNILDCDVSDLMDLKTVEDIQSLLDRNKIYFKPVN